MHAKEPDQLLFHELPVACGMEPFFAGETGGERANLLFSAIRSSIQSCSELTTICSEIFRPCS